MNGGPSSRFKPVEPNENKGGFRKIKRGEGRASVRGVIETRPSDRTMKILGVCLLVMVGIALTCLAGVLFFESSVFGMVAFGSVVLSHVLIMMGEMITHREIPTRALAIKLLWGGIVIFLVWVNFR